MEAKGLFEVKVVCDFSAAHMLRNFKGKCEHLHGHNWKIEVVIRGSRLNESEILLDFGELKETTRNILNELDHKFLNDLEYFKEHNPSSENIARYIFQELSKRLNTERVWVYSVSAWESPNSCATYYGNL